MASGPPERRRSPGSPLASRVGPVLAIGVAVFALVAGARALGLLEPLELDAYDRLLHPPAERPDPPVALVTIREEDIRRFGHPLCDAWLALAIERLLDAGARAVGVDVYRDVPVALCGGESPGPVGGASLARVAGGSDRVFMVMKLPDARGGGTPPPPFLSPAQVGFADLPVDRDGVVRRGLLYLWDEDGTPFVSFGLQLAMRYLHDEGVGLGADPDHPDAVRLGASTLPPLAGDAGGYAGVDAGGYQYLIDYGTGAAAYPRFDLAALLDGEVDPSAFEGRVVLLGTTASSVKDDFGTPYGVHREAQDAAVDGVEIHAHAVTHLIALGRGEARPIASLGEAGELGWVLAWALLGAALGLSGLSPPRVAVAGGLSLAALVALAWWLLSRSLWVPVVAPGVAGVLGAGSGAALAAVRERAERQEVTRLFSRFLHPRVADEIWRQRDALIDTGGTGLPLSRTGTLTALMSDIAGYTTASETLGPEGLVRWVNEYLKAMGRVVERHGGVVEDYAGDGIKVNFGFPLPDEEEEDVSTHARAAVRCALDMGRELERLSGEWARTGLPAPRVRIGIVTGPAVFGAIGSGDSLKYTAMGDTINTAARLETFGKDAYGADPTERQWRILIAEETERRLDGAFRTVDLGAHELRGKRAPVRIYRVLGEREEPADEETRP